MEETIYEFKTARCRVVMTATYDEYFSVADEFDDDNETARAIDAGELMPAFTVACRVYVDGHEVGNDYLGGCVYKSWQQFAEGEHRNDYFRDMVRTAISEARVELERPRLPLRSPYISIGDLMLNAAKSLDVIAGRDNLLSCSELRTVTAQAAQLRDAAHGRGVSK